MSQSLEFLKDLFERIDRAESMCADIFRDLRQRTHNAIVEERQRINVSRQTATSVSGVPCGGGEILDQFRATSSECYIPPERVEEIARGGE